MKKFSLLLLVSLLVFCGCANLKIYDKVINNLAEVRYNLYSGKTENINVTLMSGKREKNYVVNGYCTDSVDFGVITFKVKSDITMTKEINFVLTVGTTRYDGILEQNPFDGSYVYDLRNIIDSEEVITAKIIAGEFVESVELTSVTNNFNVNWDNALKIACKELNDSLQTFIENDEFKGECYVKLICDEDILGTYYWYVNFVSRFGKSYSVIIDPITNEIMAKKNI